MSQSEPPRERDIRGLHARIERLEQSMKAELEKKVDARVAELEIAQLKDSVGKHECYQVAQIAVMSSSMESAAKSVQKIEESLNRWRTFKISGVLAIVLAVISGAAYLIKTNARTSTVRESVERIEDDVANMRAQIEKYAPSQYGDELTIQQIKEAIREELSRGD